MGNITSGWNNMMNYGKTVNDYEVTIKVKCVPGEDAEEVFDELADILIDLDILPYDYNMTLEKVGEWL